MSLPLRVLGLLRRHGWNATSFQILEPGFRYWFDGDDACIGYVDTGRAWVVAGAPIAPPERFPDLARAFVAHARQAGKRVVFFATESRFRDAVDWRALRIGEQPTWSPEEWTATLEGSRSLREQLRRARAKGVRIRRLAPDELAPGHPTRARLDSMIARWLASRPMAPMGFLVQVDPYTFPDERHAFVAEIGDRLIGFLGVIPIYARGGWFFEDFLGDPDAPNGTVESLIDAGMRAAAADRIAYVTLGLAPLAGDVGVRLRAVRRWGRLLYDFDGLRTFKARFKPRAWDPIYLSYPRGRSSMGAIRDVLTAFSRGGLLGFGVQTLMRGPAVAMRLLALLLAPWTLLLALPGSAAWFPSEAWRWGWVVFDVLVIAGLYRLSERWRPRLATLLAAAMGLDALLTLVQAVAHTLPRRHGVFDLVVVSVAVLAPAIAAAILWTGRAHRRPA